MSEPLHVRFEHGLGDCVYFAHQLPLYLRRGHNIIVSCNRDKEVLFHAARVPVSAGVGRGLTIEWFEGEEPAEDLRFDNYWRWSKMARNLSLPPMPDIGNPAYLWEEYCDVTLDAGPFIGEAAKQAAGGYAATLARPLLLLHTHGNTSGERKNVPDAIVRQVCRELLKRTEGTILVLDWDARVPPLPHWRVRHAQHDFGRLSTEQLLVLLDCADLIIGVDSGPLHAARFTRTPSIGIWMGNGSPPTWSLPRALQANVVVGTQSRCWRKQARLPFNILECDETELLPAVVGRAAERMLAGCRYLPDGWTGRDILLQQFVRDWQGGADNAFGGFNDRDEGFDRLLRIAARRFERPRIVETGCIREEEDFRGAGCSTLLLGMFAASHGGELVSVDIDAQHCDLARRTVVSLGAAVDVVESDSVAWLERNRQPIDVLYLDSIDADCPGVAEHGLREITSAHDCLGESSIVAWDDTFYVNGCFIGAGALGVPWLMERGWRILHSGHQTILSRTGS